MENAHTPSEPSGMDTAARNPLMQRLKHSADTLLRAYEAVTVPKDYAGIGKAARTLINLTRLINAVFGHGTAPKRRRPADPLETEVAAIAAEAETCPALTPVLNRQQRRREEKLRRTAKLPERAAFAMSP